MYGLDIKDRRIVLAREWQCWTRTVDAENVTVK